MREHNFSPAVVKEIGQRAMYICANPDCRCFTGYAAADGKPRTIAEGAHILPAGKTGPRSGDISAYIDVDLSSGANGLWLCRSCHAQVDADPRRFGTALLFEWKENHEALVRRLVGKDLESALLALKNEKRYHELVRDFISFMEDRRVLYEGMDSEFPDRVLESLELIRNRVVSTRASLEPNSALFASLHQIQVSINNFLKNIGRGTDLRTLRCDSNDPAWRLFSSELAHLRKEILIVLTPLAGVAGYRSQMF